MRPGARTKARRKAPRSSFGFPVNKKHAIIALVLGPPLILALIVAGLVAATFHFAENLNDYRGSIAAGASEALGRPVEIGAASLQLRPLLDLSLEEVTVGNLPDRPAEPTFLRFQRFRVALDPVSLFAQGPRIEHLELNGLRLNLVRDRAPEAEPAAPPAPAPAPSAPTTLPPVVLASANITDARILLHDRHKNRQLLIEELTVQLDGDGKLQGGMRLRATPPDLEGRLKLQGTLAYDEDSAALQPLRLELELAGDTLPGGRGQLQLDTGLLFSLDAGTLRIEPSQLRGLGLQIQGQGRIAPAAAQAQLEAQGENLPRLLRILGLELDAPGRKEELSFRLRAPELRLEEDKAIARKLELELLGASLRADLEGSAPDGERPRWQGQFQGGGPDLPRLLQLYSLLYGEPQSPLARIADAYAAAQDRSFELSGRFALNGAGDRFEVPELSARTLGMELAGHLNQEGDQSLRGELRLDADRNISRLLNALGQERWGGRVRSLQLRADIAGAPPRPRLAPLRLLLQLAGDEQPLELQGQAWWERSGKPPRAGLEELSVSGPGLRLAGDARLQLAPLGVEARLQAPTIEPRRLLPLLLDRMPATADPKALSRAGFDAELRLDSGQWRLDLKKMHVDEAELRGDFLFAPGGPDGARARATLQLEAGRLNLDRYLPPPAAAGAQDKTGDKAPAAADSDAWIEPLRNLEIEGKATIEELILRRLRLQKIVLGLQREGETIRVSPLSVSGYGGQLAASGELDLGGERPRYSLSGEGTAIDLGDVLQDLAGRSRLEGTLGLEWQLAGQGLSGDELRRGLGGSASLRLRDGAYRGIDVMKKIEVWRALTDWRPGEHGHQDDAETRTELAMLDATLRIGEGVIRNDDLSASAPRLRLTGKGNYQLEENLLDYQVTAALDAGLTIPIRISGRPPRLSYVPELGDLLKKSILGKIEEKLFPKTTDTAGEGEAAGEKETQERKERPKDLKDDLKDALRDLLPF